MDLSILGTVVPVTRRPDVSDGQWATIAPRMQGFPAAIDGVGSALSEDQRNIFLLTRGIVIFERIRFKGRSMSRSFMDLDNGLFHWCASELVHPGYQGAARVASYYYHDAFHVRQYLDGRVDPDIEARIDREVEATTAQIRLATMMGADRILLDDLTEYANDRDAIRARLNTGVGILGWLLGRPRYEDHFLIL